MTATAPERSEDSVKRLTLIACILATGLTTLDSTIVNVALPTIQRDLGGGLAAQQWVVNAYLVTLGSLILIGGSLGDVFGPRRVFAIGVGGFGAASVLCAAAPSDDFLVVARGVQGMAGALLMPSALAVIMTTFPPPEIGGAIGSWAAWSASAALIGPLAGGGLLEITSWRWIFLVNVPLVALTLALVLMAVPRAPGRGPDARRVDVPGAVMAALGLGAVVFALIEQPRKGWDDPGVLIPLIAGAVVLVAFLLYESRAKDPMLPLGLFRRRNFAAGNIETLAVYGGLALLFFFLVLLLQQVEGYSAIESGLALMPITLVIIALSRRAGALAGRFGPRVFMGVGPLLCALGLLLLQRVEQPIDYWAQVFPAVIVFALGMAITVAPLTTAVLVGAGPQTGIASGVNNAIARLAGLVAIAALGAVVAASFGSELDDRVAKASLGPAAMAEAEDTKRLPLGLPDVDGLPSGEARALTEAAQAASFESFHLAMAIAAALAALGGIAGFAGIRNPPPMPPPSP